ncbi:MAG: lipoyl synthase [Armatimonadota bacterium]
MAKDNRLGGPKPPWIKAKAPAGENYSHVRALVDKMELHTVCQSAHCPNIGECWHAKTATFMILGNTCTRNCRFCAVDSGCPEPVDENEPERVGEAVKTLGLKHSVITSVTRDDLPDGGASIFAGTIKAIRRLHPTCSIEVLIPDFAGSEEPLRVVVEARPDILNHNIETVERMYQHIRPQAIYTRSLELLRRSKNIDPTVLTKSGIMVGVGETIPEIVETMKDLREYCCDILTIGQYLRPSVNHAPIDRYYTPEEFEELKKTGLELGFRHVESAPLVRSSYHAAEQMK